MAKILIETSARHIHLSQEHLDILFGAGHELTKKKDLSQPGQYACEEKNIKMFLRQVDVSCRCFNKNFCHLYILRLK